MGFDGHDPEAASGEVRSLVLRAWLEPAADPVLRVRVVEIGPGLSERTIAVTASPAEASRAVRDWLEALEARQA